METSKEDVLKFLRSWRTSGELLSKFGIKNPGSYVAGLYADGYDIKTSERDMGMFTVLCYRWTGIKN